MTGTDIVHVPYKGGGPALADVVDGHVQVLFNTMTSTVGFMNSGKLRALGVTGKQRSSGVPNLPTVADAGVPGYDVGAWFGIVVPKGTPRPVVMKLNDEIVRITWTPEAREQFTAQGAEAAKMRAEYRCTRIGPFRRYSELWNPVLGVEVDGDPPGHGERADARIHLRPGLCVGRHLIPRPARLVDQRGCLGLLSPA